jgi:hypothetical protein
MNYDPRLLKKITSHPYPLIFATISGAHLYGFPSPDSDYDLRGVHVLPVKDIAGLDEPRETIESEEIDAGMEIDLVTHDLKKFIRLMLTRNGYVLEQLLSPLVLHTTPVHEELKALAPGCITRFHAHHYLGFVETQWRLFAKESPPRIKPLLYVFRVLLTGIHLMHTGQVEANLLTLNETFKLPYIPELVERKVHGAEKGTLNDADLSFYQSEHDRLRAMLEQARDVSHLPESASSWSALNDVLIRTRLATV